MRCRLVTAATTLAALASMPERPGRPFGKAAYELTEAEVLRIEDRTRRMRYSRGQSMGPAELVAFAARKRRAAQGKPGKRR